MQRSAQSFCKVYCWTALQFLQDSPLNYWRNFFTPLRNTICHFQDLDTPEPHLVPLNPPPPSTSSWIQYILWHNLHYARITSILLLSYNREYQVLFYMRGWVMLKCYWGPGYLVNQVGFWARKHLRFSWELRGWVIIEQYAIFDSLFRVQ